MAEQRGAGPGAGMPPPGWRLPPVVPPPSPGFTATPMRPHYREPHPVRAGGLLVGIGATGAWLLLFGAFGGDLPGYLWCTLFAGAVAWAVAAVLGRFGDRGAAAGIAMTTAVGWAVAAGTAAVNWAVTGDWPMW